MFHAINSDSSYTEIVHTLELQTYRLFDKGETIRKNVASTNFGFSCEVSDADWVDVKKQMQDAAIFLKTNKEKLHRIKELIPETIWHLDFPIESRLSNKIAVQCDFIPVELIKHCADLEIGIELSTYNSRRLSLIERMINKIKKKTGTET